MLSICRKTFTALNKEGILYCHWKSNEHLREGLCGQTDLDILVERHSFNRVNQLLLEAGYIRCKTVSYLDYNAVEDFLGFDEETGSIVHLHLHYALVVGRKFLKEYHLPLEREIFQTRVYNETCDIYTIKPELELILLIIRRAIKATAFSRFASRKGIFIGGEQREFSWLMEKVDFDSLQEMAANLLGLEFGRLVRSFLESRALDNKALENRTLECSALEKRAERNFKKIRKIVNRGLRKYCLYSGPGRFLRYYRQKLLAGWNYLKSRKLNRPFPYRRGLKKGGVVIAFLGVDGAGKSTLLRIINDWLSWKLDVQQIYFGSGEGRSSLLRLPLKMAAQVRNRLRGEVVDKARKEYSRKEKSRIFKFVRFLWAVTLAQEKKKKLFKMWQARTRGMVVLCDRFPQTQFYGFNDGPLLGDWADSQRTNISSEMSADEGTVKSIKDNPDMSSNKGVESTGVSSDRGKDMRNDKSSFKNSISEWEYRIYRLSEELPPDIVFKLTVSPEVSAERKKDTPMFMLEEKKRVVDELEFKGGTRVYVIDSSGTVEETALEIKRKIWSSLQ